MFLTINNNKFRIDYLNKIDPEKFIKLIPPKIAILLADYKQRVIMVEWLELAISAFYVLSVSDIKLIENLWFKKLGEKKFYQNFVLESEKKFMLRLAVVKFLKNNEKKEINNQPDLFFFSDKKVMDY